MSDDDEPIGVPKQMPKLQPGLWGAPSASGIQAHRIKESYTMTDKLKSPFPWPGGKSDQAGAIWARLGDVANFVEPFCGSAAVLLGRPHDLNGKTETLNDLDGLLINAFRAITFDPETTADWCDYPVSEADLTARHLHLKAARDSLTARLFADPFYYDPILAAFWLWGIASWIGDGWCVADGPWIALDGRLVDRRTIGSDEPGVSKRIPSVAAADANGTGANENLRGIQKYRAPGVPRKIPNVGANPDDHAPNIRGVNKLEFANGALLSYFARLSDRLRRTRFLCGDWTRAVKDSVTVNHGTSGIFLDPEYPSDEHDMSYHEAEKRKEGAPHVWYQAAAWAIEHGDDPRLRICIAGYWSEATDALFPATWERVRWEARGGYANQKANGRGRANAKRECLWFSPHCLNPADEARDTLSRPIVVRASDYSGTMFEDDE